MRTAGFSRQYVQYMEAQILVSQGKWFEALRQLRNLQPQFSNHPQLSVTINFQIGLCNERLGRREKAIEAYNLVLQQNPLNEPASLGRQRILLEIGRPDEDSKNQQLQKIITQELAKPKDKRNWASIDAEAAKFAEEMEYKDAILDMFWARLMLAREDFASAKRYLSQANVKDPDNINVHRLAMQVLRFDPNAGPDKAILFLDGVVSQFGDQAPLRLDRADLILSSDIELEEKKSQITELAQGTSDWTDDAKAELLDGLAIRSLALGMRDEAMDYWNRVADLRPDDLPTRVRLFSLAVEANDDAGMQAAQEKILGLVKSKNDSTWMYTEARRLMSLYRREQLDKAALADVGRLIDRAFNLRPDWFELHLVKAELELLNGNEDAALVHLEKAEALGRANPQAILQHVRLLLNRGQYEPAKALVEQLPEATREGQVAQVYAEILLNSGNVEDAVKVARKFNDLDAENPGRQLWFGQLLVRSAATAGASPELQKTFLDDAKGAFQKSVELGPDSQEAWLALISLHVVRRDMEQARQALQQAQLALPEDQLVGVLAKGLEIMGYWFDAENIYVTLYNADRDNLLRARQLATFYLGPYYQRQDKVAKAAPLINQILHAAADGKLVTNDPTVMWARRTGAQLLAATRDYQLLLRAEKLLRSNSQDGKLTIEDQLRLAEILAPRYEPESRFTALALLEQVAKQQRLNLQGDMTLGQLYFAVGQWQKCRQQMRETVSRYPDSAEARMAYIRMILQHGDKRYYNEASQQLDKLLEIASTNAQTIELMVRVASKTGKQADARKNLLRLVPRVTDPKDITEDQLPILEYVATLMVELDDLDNAEKIFRMIVARDPRKTLALANFLGEHRDVAQCMEIIDQLYEPDLAEPVARVSIAVVRSRRDEVGEKYDEQVLRWLGRGLVENPDSLPLLMLSAEFDDLRKEYDMAAETYQKLLARKDLTGLRRAVVLNNLAYLIALAGSDAQVSLDPLELVQEAAEILGPTADILDTRAVVYTSQGEYQKAIRDSALSVTDKPSSAKYFHKAVAHLEAGENTAAIEAWEKAEELGDIRSELNRLEYDRFNDATRRIEEVRAQRRQLTDTDRYRAAG
jgi:tetratricopeptide (TPR) repeat protein